MVGLLQGLPVYPGEVLGEGWLVVGKAAPSRTFWKISVGVISSQSR